MMTAGMGWASSSSTREERETAMDRAAAFPLELCAIRQARRDISASRRNI